MSFGKNLGEKYSPLYYLAALGSGGLVITFFMYLMFLTPHKGYPIPVYGTLINVLKSGSLFQRFVVVVGVAGVAFFAYLHFRLLFWNIKEYSNFKKTKKFEELKRSPAEVQLMVIPLTYAMTVNVLFMVGAIFIPHLWNVVEYIFPFALLAFFAIGVYGVKIFMDFISRVVAFGGFDTENNNSLSQMLSIFAFTMIAVGFSATGAMSHNPLVSAIGIVFSVGFLSVATVFGIIKLVIGFHSMFKHGVNREASISLWIIIPILTVAGIALFRNSMGLHHNFNVHIHPTQHLVLFTVIVALQLFFGLLGYMVMKRINYFKEFIDGKSESVTAYAAICPGVALFVMLNFLLNKGFVGTGLIYKLSIIYLLLYVPLIYLQLKTIIVLFRLNRKLIKA
ncbi:TsoY family (seleno)protein [Desulfurobacterium sp.]